MRHPSSYVQTLHRPGPLSLVLVDLGAEYPDLILSESWAPGIEVVADTELFTEAWDP